MWNSPTPLSPSERAAFERLEQQLEGTEDAVMREEAINYLTTGEFDYPEATHLLEQLLLKGYLYESEAGLRITS